MRKTNLSMLENCTEWVITLPATTSWAEYERELNAVKTSGVLNFRVPFRPRHVRPGHKCYVLYRGQVRGYMFVTAVFHHKHGFTCETTGAFWKPGHYIQRAGAWFALIDGPKARGFRGLRRYGLVSHARPVKKSRMLDPMRVT